QVRAAIRSLEREGLPRKIQPLGGVEIRHLHDFTPSRSELVLALAAACERAVIPLRVEVPAGCSPAVDAAVDPVLAEWEQKGQRFTQFEVFKADLTLEKRPLA